jgi:hypothetical protein
MVYYYEKMFDKSCENIRKAESLGFKIDDYKELKQIKKRYCE